MATCPGEMQMELVVLLLRLGHSLPYLEETCGLKILPRLSSFLKCIPWHKWAATRRAHCAILSTLSSSCDVLHYHRSTLFFFFEGKKESLAVCKPQYYLPLPHKPQIKGLSIPNHREVPRAPRSRHPAVHFLLDTHIQDCAVCNIQ